MRTVSGPPCSSWGLAKVSLTYPWCPPNLPTKMAYSHIFTAHKDPRHDLGLCVYPPHTSAPMSHTHGPTGRSHCLQLSLVVRLI